MVEVIAFGEDMFLQVKIASAADRIGDIHVSMATDEFAVWKVLKEKKATVLFADLDHPTEDMLTCIKDITASYPLYVLAYTQQVNDDVKNNALQAGCHEVLAQKVFSARLTDIMARVKEK